MDPRVITGLSIERQAIEEGTITERKYVDLRDQFAIAALPEILAQKDIHVEHERKNAAWLAYQIADDMLAARNA